MSESDRKTQKNLYLPVDVCTRLEEESNQGEIVERLLREEFDL